MGFAEAMTRSDRRPDAALIARLRAHFDDDAIIELAALIAYQNMSSKFNAALGVPSKGSAVCPSWRNNYGNRSRMRNDCRAEFSRWQRDPPRPDLLVLFAALFSEIQGRPDPIRQWQR